MMLQFGLGSLVTLAIVAVIALASCQREMRDQSATPAADSTTALAQTDTSYRITLSSGGGFSGFTRGFTLFGSGRIEYWQRARVGQDTLLKSLAVSPAEIARFRNELIQSGALQKEVHSTGNITNRVVFATMDTTYTWMWGGEKAAESVPKPLLMWYQSVRKYCEQANQKDH